MIQKQTSFPRVNHKSMIKNHSNFTQKDVIDRDFFELFLNNVAGLAERQKDLREAQLKITYKILYFRRLRIHQIRHLTQKDFESIINKGKLCLVNNTSKEEEIHIFSPEIINEFKNLDSEFKIIFDKYHYKYLFGKKKPITDKNLIRIVNQDLENTCVKYNLGVKITSDHFRFSGPKLRRYQYYYEE